MASDTVPAAVPDPQDRAQPAGAITPGKGLLASLVAPVGPARPDFDLAPATPAGEPSDMTVDSGSSAAYHDTDTKQNNASGNGPTNGVKSIWRAWLLAGAARWAKGGGTANKRLDMQKAQAQAQKEVRQVKVNRSEGSLFGGGSSGGNSGGSGGGGKSLGSKNTPGNNGKGGSSHSNSPKNHSSGNGSAGSSGGNAGKSGSGGGSGGAGHHGGSGGKGSGNSGSGGPGKGSTGHDSGTGKAPKGDGGSKSSTGNGSTGAGKNGAQGPSGASGKDGAAGKSDGAGKNRTDKPVTTTTCGEASGINLAKDKKPTDPAKTPKTTGGADGKDGKTQTPAAGSAGAPGKPGANTGTSGAAAGQAKTPTKPDAAKDAPKPIDVQKTDGKPQTVKDPATKDQTPAPGGKPITTQTARETGYRDGTRAARVTAHVKAYRDGVKDGWTDTTEAAQREKARLDAAHQQRKQDRAEDKPMAPTATQQQAQPIGVRSVTETHVYLDEGASRYALGRGEVRSLKKFELRLEEKAAALAKIAENTKALKAHADAQAAKATRLLEQAKAVKPGDKVIAALAKLADTAKTQATNADEIHQRAVRAADACKAVLANVQTRYGGIYKAVADSGLATPAEGRFYREGNTAHV